VGPATQPTRDVPLGRLAIIGTGLIGASVGLAAKRAGAERVVGYDADPEALAAAAERGALDERAGSIVGAVEDAELVLVATPVATLAEQISTVLASSERCTVSDVGSTKGRLCAGVDDRARFIGGHPVCGSEARGAAHASAELFEGATWFLTPVAETEPERYRLLHGFVASLAAVPVAIDPDAHDRLLALTSHLPHALANVVLNHAGSLRVDGHEPLAAAAGGSLRDMTRVAGANPRIWIDIFLDNAAELRSALGEHRRRVEELERALDSGDAGWLARWIGEAGGNRRRLLEEAFTDVGELQRVRVHVPDRPGVLSGITQALGAEQIDIEDFELQHLSPERGGTLSVLVAGESEARRAAELLEAQGYAVIVSPAFEDA
jgi:prephenate dehydrogenase